MADINYTVSQDLPENIDGFEQYSQEDKSLISSFQINSVFDPEKNYSELHILSLSDELLESDYLYNRHKQLGNAQSAGQTGASVLSIDPIADIKYYGYDGGGIKLLYHFLDDLYTDDITTREFFIQDISPDRTEVVLNSLNITQDEVTTYTSTIKDKLESQSYFAGFRLNFKSNDLVIATNIDTIDSGIEKVVTIKLYEPLPEIYDLKSTLTIVEIVSDSIAYEVDSEYIIQPEQAPTLRSANFNIEIADQSVIPTEYLNYDELFSYPVSNANNEIFSAINEKGIDISIDYTDFSNFIHFSSAQERLMNFKYKADLINSYSASLASYTNTTTGLQGVSGSRLYYEGLITGVVSNFDHYERFLYYESGSSSWPKSNTTKPYTNKNSTDNEAVLWYNSQIEIATYYDQTNYNSLVNSIPAYLRDDANNDNYLTFVYMIGQHFDNLWLYSKAVTDKYDGDNRLDRGISKDLVGEALINFGIKLYTSNKSTQDLFSTFTGQAYQSGSEKIDTYITGSVANTNQPIQPSSLDNYQKEVQKRLYHNLPLLLKTKGTQRGIKALLNCFGIPREQLDVKLYGGRNVNERSFFGDYTPYSSSIDKIRIDNTGSITQGNTLSGLTSIVQRDSKYTDDLHTIEIGFSPTSNIDNYIISKSQGTFNIDEYLGDPRNNSLDNYSGLLAVGESLTSGSIGTSITGSYDLQDYVRLIKFYDNTVFKMIKDFTPARSTVDTGIIIKPTVLNRSKNRAVAVSGGELSLTASIDTAFIEAADGGAFDTVVTSTGYHNTSWTEVVQTPQGLNSRYNNSGSDQPLYTGELSGSRLTVTDQDLNANNPYKTQTPYDFQDRPALLVTDFPQSICAIGSTYPTVYVTAPTTVDVRSAFNIPGDIYVTYYSASTDITSQASAYPISINYATYNIIASKSAAGSCQGTKPYIANFCVIDEEGVRKSNPIIQADFAYDITTWLTSSVNTGLQYTASYYSQQGALLGTIPLTASTATIFDSTTIPLNSTVYVTTVDPKIINGCSLTSTPKTLLQKVTVSVINNTPYTYISASTGPASSTVVGRTSPESTRVFSYWGTAYGNGSSGLLLNKTWYSSASPSLVQPTASGQYTASVLIPADIYYPSISSSLALFSVEKAVLTVTPNSRTIIPGTAGGHLTASISNSFSITNFVGNDVSESAIYQNGTTFTYSSNYTPSLPSGSTGISMSIAINNFTSSNYTFISGITNITIGNSIYNANDYSTTDYRTSSYT